MSNLVNANEKEKHKHIADFWAKLDSDLKSKRFSKIEYGSTKYTVKKGTSTVSQYGVKKRYILTKDSRSITFAIEVRPFMWNDGTVWVEIQFEDAEKLNVPTAKIKPKTQGAIWKPSYDKFFFLTNTDSVVSYIQALEKDIDVSPVDVLVAKAEELI